MNTVLETKDLNKWYPLGRDKRVNVLKNIDLVINRGEFVSVMGPSGSGKSTLLYTISGMDRVSSGSVRFNGREINKLPEKELSRLRLKEMGFIFQQIHLLKNLSLLDNIMLSAYLNRGRSRSEINRRARRLMELTGIAPLARNSTDQASGGQLQRVGICRGLINEPAVLFGDEPTGALDSQSALEILDIIKEVHSSGTSVVLVTHDTGVAARSERVLYMLDGRITAEKTLGTFSGGKGEARTRQESLNDWLANLSRSRNEGPVCV
ncbi:ABC transporter ATP-binding protein [Marispirochaeta sp.]|uniref:ABC transporter ATP-binding protein n=1 Tax=Marispirochaeta sp. TaxID=2038653 RepID=UPI0029C61F81|nr:ABC transporter ATP-binding protein [Marispirochaeta sp.]